MDDDGPTYRWFGTNWGAPANKLNLQIPVPVGDYCSYCLALIDEEDSGVRIPFLSWWTRMRRFSYSHRDCFLRSIGVDPSLAGSHSLATSEETIDERES